MLYANKNLRELKNKKVNTELGNLCDWPSANKLSLTTITYKSNIVIFRPRQKSLPFIPRISVLDYEMNSHKPLKMKEYFKHLGVYIDADLSCKHHIEHISGKISNCVGVIANLRHFVPCQTVPYFALSNLWHMCLGLRC